MQEPAWTEADKPHMLESRLARAPADKHKQVAQQPVFCVETALKMHRWSDLAYTDFAEAPRGVQVSGAALIHKQRSWGALVPHCITI